MIKLFSKENFFEARHPGMFLSFYFFKHGKITISFESKIFKINFFFVFLTWYFFIIKLNANNLVYFNKCKIFVLEKKWVVLVSGVFHCVIRIIVMSSLWQGDAWQRWWDGLSLIVICFCLLCTMKVVLTIENFRHILLFIKILTSIFNFFILNFFLCFFIKF